MNLYTAAHAAIHDGGFTIDRNGTAVTSGYAVGTRPDSETAIRLGQARHSDTVEVAMAIERFAAKYAADLRTGDYYIGAWKDDGAVVLDLVRIYPSKMTALGAALGADQQAIYHLDTRATIYVGPAMDEQRERQLDDVGEWEADDGRWDDDPNPYSGTDNTDMGFLADGY